MSADDIQFLLFVGVVPALLWAVLWLCLPRAAQALAEFSWRVMGGRA